MSFFLTRHPEIRCDGLSAALDDCICEADLIVQLQRARLPASAREVVPGSEVLSIIRTRTPSRISHSPNTSPVGPAPTTRTSVS